MDLRHLTDACLLTDTKTLVRRERQLLTAILHHLREIERRRLFGQYASLYEYAMGELGYSRDQAFRRMAAVHMLDQLPELELKIESGEINLAHMGMAQSLFSSEKKAGQPMSTEEKREVFEAMAGQSTRDAQRTVQTFSSTPLKLHDGVKALGDGRNLVTAVFSDELMAKIRKLKGLLAHQMPDAKLGEILDKACDVALEQLNPAKPPRRRTKPESRAAIRRQIWARDGNACQLCKSTHAVQEDHIIPKSMNGPYTLENIRLLCRRCNQRAAIEKLGLDKMKRHLRRRYATSRSRENSQEVFSSPPVKTPVSGSP